MVTLLSHVMQGYYRGNRISVSIALTLAPDLPDMAQTSHWASPAHESRMKTAGCGEVPDMPDLPPATSIYGNQLFLIISLSLKKFSARV
jgi:hypothetical protein